MSRFSHVLIFLLILSLLFSFGYAAVEGVHDCHGEADCPICKVITILSSFLGIFSLPLLLFVGLRLREEKVACERKKTQTGSPILLKVKMTN